MSPHHGRFTPRADQPEVPRPKLSRVLRELRPERWKIIAVFVISAISVALNVSGPRLLGEATNVIFNGLLGKMIPPGTDINAVIKGMRAEGKDRMADMLSAAHVTPGVGIDFGALAGYVLAVLAVYLTAALLMYISGLIVRQAVQNIGYRLRQNCSQKINTLKLSYLDSHGRGDLLSRVTNDVDNLTQSLQQTISQMFNAILQLIGIIAMMLWISWQLALIAFIVLPLGGVLAAAVMKRSQPQFERQWKATGEVSEIVEEAFTGAQVLSLYQLEDDFNTRFDASNDGLRVASFKANFISSLLQPMIGFVSNLSYVVVAVGGGVMVAHGMLSLGGVQAFIQYSRQLGQPLGQLSSMANLLQSAFASAGRIFEFLDSADVEDDATAAPAGWGKEPGGAIEFRNVTFSYKPGEPVIKNLSLKVEPGQQVAIVGPTGAGKTTLVNLLLRFYEVDSGEILFDGVPTREIPKDVLRARVGMVLQDTWLIQGTIEENIGFGTEYPAPEKVRAAAEATGSHRLISHLPEGYQTQVEESGEGLSAGEKQLLTIARAFIAEPDVLILDEATSSVDTRTEMLVGEAMNRLRHGRTSFVIAHRLSTIRDADVIVVMEDGDVVEQGTHAQLLEAQGAYARLYQAQFDAPVE